MKQGKDKTPAEVENTADVKADYLRIREVAELLHVSVRCVYNLIYASRLKAYRLSSRLTVIPRQSLRNMLDESDYVKAVRKKKALTPTKGEKEAVSLDDIGEVTEWYAIGEVLARYHITVQALWRLRKTHPVPMRKEGVAVYLSKPHIDRLMLCTLDESPDEWYTVDEIMKKFGLTRKYTFNYIQYHHITKMKKGATLYVSRSEFDAHKRQSDGIHL